jgi:hypothetical protein
MVAIGVGVVVLAAVAFMLFAGGEDLDTEAAPVENYAYPVQMFPPDPAGRPHFAEGETYDDYNSNPPTSGPHTSVAAGPGVHDEPVPKETLVHSMEHGYVVVWYNCNGGPEPLTADQCSQLAQDASAIATNANENGKKVVMTPFAGMENRIAITSWQFPRHFRRP